MQRIIYSLLIAFLLATIPFSIPQYEVEANVVSAAELIDWMNGNRSANGYAPLVRNSLLDSSAASLAYAMYERYESFGCGHPGGKMERVAASGYGGGSTFIATENIACATTADISWFARYDIWGDPIHQLPATDPNYKDIGAFAYTAPNGVTFYAMYAANTTDGGAASVASSESEAPAAVEAPSVQLVEPVVTATPQEDGSIVHIVQYGQALDTIATWYGVTIAEIKALNGLTSDRLYPGDNLIIKLAPTVTITPTRTITPLQPTRTPSLTPTPTKVVIPNTPTPTEEPGLVESLPKLDRQWLGFGLLLISAVGLMLVLYFLFIRPRFKK